MKVLTINQFHAELRAQGVDRDDLAFVCPMCKTVQSARDLMRAGAGETFEQVERYLAFSCVGRWGGPKFVNGMRPGKGCDWTLGGLFSTHQLEVVDEAGKVHPRFEPASPAEAQAHAAAAAATHAAPKPWNAKRPRRPCRRRGGNVAEL